MASELQERIASSEEAELLDALETAHTQLREGKWHRHAYVVTTPTVDVRAIRERLGLSQTAFAVRFGLSVKSLRNWEQGIREPDGATRSYLSVIAREPEAVARALEAERREQSNAIEVVEGHDRQNG